MNIFVVHTDPTKAARMLADQHIVKMPTETAQMLATAFYYEPKKVDGKWIRKPLVRGIIPPYKPSHYNHGCNIWIRESLANYRWLLSHGWALYYEYQARYKNPTKHQKCKNMFLFAEKYMHLLNLPDIGLTPFYQAINSPSSIVSDNPVLNYRMFYRLEKSKFARWNHTKPPKWYGNNGIIIKDNKLVW